MEIFNAEVWDAPPDQTAATVRERFAAVLGGAPPGRRRKQKDQERRRRRATATSVSPTRRAMLFGTTSHMFPAAIP